MNTKIIVALIVGIALVGLTGAASAATYDLNGNYVYTDSASNSFVADTNLYTEVVGNNSNGVPTHMHSHIYNTMNVTTISSNSTSVNSVIHQGGATTMRIETGMPKNMNTFASTDQAFQNIVYGASGDAFEIGFKADSDTHASTHYGILPIGPVALWDYNAMESIASVNYTNDVPMASIKSGRTGYVCESHGDVLMEAEHVLGAVTAGSGITLWGEAQGEIWEPMGRITNDVEGDQYVYIWWPTP